MIYFYSGTPGSGKSLHVAKDILTKLKIKKQNVIANFDINREKIYKGKKKRKNYGNFYYIENKHLTVDFLINYAKKFHKKNVENQTLLVIDEAQVILGPTAVKIACYSDKEYRDRWIKFFSQHRKYGYSVVIVSQFDRLIDPQIRCQFEYNMIHRKANNFGTIGLFLSLFRLPLFCSVCYWYGVNQRIGAEFYTCRKKYSSIYDSYALFGN